MALHSLENARWGFESMCFVCEPNNGRGLQIPFFHDDERDLVRAEFTLTEDFSGAPTYVHGGVLLAVMDEAMAWGTIALAQSFALTHTTAATFHHPVRVGRAYRVEARRAAPEAGDGARLRMTAVVVDGKDRPCAEASAVFVPLDAGLAASAIGTEVSGDDARYLQSDPPD